MFLSQAQSPGGAVTDLQTCFLLLCAHVLKHVFWHQLVSACLFLFFIRCVCCSLVAQSVGWNLCDSVCRLSLFVCEVFCRSGYFLLCLNMMVFIRLLAGAHVFTFIHHPMHVTSSSLRVTFVSLRKYASCRDSSVLCRHVVLSHC